jgi:hypothetical protein
MACEVVMRVVRCVGGNVFMLASLSIHNDLDV